MGFLGVGFRWVFPVFWVRLRDRQTDGQTDRGRTGKTANAAYRTAT